MGWPVYLINSTLCMSLWVSLTYFVEPPYKVSLYPPSTIAAAMFKMGLQLTKAIWIWYILLKICVGLVSGPNLIQYSYHFQYNTPCAMHLILKVILKVICVRDWEYNTDESALEFGLHIHWSKGGHLDQQCRVSTSDLYLNTTLMSQHKLLLTQSSLNLIQYSYHFQYNMPCAMCVVLTEGELC